MTEKRYRAQLKLEPLHTLEDVANVYARLRADDALLHIADYKNADPIGTEDTKNQCQKEFNILNETSKNGQEPVKSYALSLLSDFSPAKKMAFALHSYKLLFLRRYIFI